YTWALPNKIFDFVQARLATVVGPSPEMAELVRERRLGVVAEDFTPQALADALAGLDPAAVAEYQASAHAQAPEPSDATESSTSRPSRSTRPARTRRPSSSPTRPSRRSGSTRCAASPDSRRWWTGEPPLAAGPRLVAAALRRPGAAPGPAVRRPLRRDDGRVR